MNLADHLYRFVGFILEGMGGPAFWTISSSGHVIGSLTLEAGKWRLTWFENADPRLRDYRGAVTDDVEALAETLRARFGIPVSFDPVLV
jgi:hypothetical protein